MLDEGEIQALVDALFADVAFSWPKLGVAPGP